MKELLIPVPLLETRSLSASAKLLWMILALSQPKEAQAFLSRQTVAQARAQLEATGWLPCPVAAAFTTVRVPADLILFPSLGGRAKLLYCYLRALPANQATHAQLAEAVGSSPTTIRNAVRELEWQGWLQVRRKNKQAPLYFTLRNPVAERQEGEVAAAARRLEEASFKGEALMREFLSLLIDSDEYEDNASPGFLVNPFTGERLQYDRYYPPRVAFEFNGPQHYGPTERYTDAWKQRGRDYIKRGISVERGIQLVIIQAEDLSLQAMQAKVSILLPSRDLQAHQPLAQYLDRVSRAYRKKARQRLAPPHFGQD